MLLWPGSRQRAALYHSQPPVGVCPWLCHTPHFHHVSTTTTGRGPSAGLGAGLQSLWSHCRMTQRGSVPGMQRWRQTLTHTLEQKQQNNASPAEYDRDPYLSQFVSDGGVLAWIQVPYDIGAEAGGWTQVIWFELRLKYHICKEYPCIPISIWRTWSWVLYQHIMSATYSIMIP